MATGVLAGVGEYVGSIIGDEQFGRVEEVESALFEGEDARAGEDEGVAREGDRGFF